MRFPRFALPLLALAAASPLHGQAAATVAPFLPTCAAEGMPRLGVMPPPDADTALVRRQLAASSAIAEGVELRFIGREEAPALRDMAAAERQLGRLLGRLANQGLQAEGEAVSIVSLDAEGAMTNVVPGSGHTEVDRAIRTFWRAQRFDPPVVGGCRAQAWLRVPIEFKVDDSGVQVRVAHPARERRP